MHARLVSYLRDNRDQIIENWLTEVKVPAPIDSIGAEGGVVPYEFFTAAFDGVLDFLERSAHPLGSVRSKHEPEKTLLSRFLGITCDCREPCFGGRVCMELHDAGLHAYMSVFADDWDAEHEFDQSDRERGKGLINHALSGFFDREIKHCRLRTLRSDCPFVAHN